METGSAFPLSVYLGVLKRRKRLLIVAFVALAILSIYFGDTREAEQIVPTVYKSRMKLLVTPPDRDRNPEKTNELETWFASEALLKRLVLSEEVLERTVQAGGFPYDGVTLRQMITFFEDSSTEEQVGSSFILNLEVTSDAAETSEKIATVLRNEIVEYTQDMAARELVASRKLLEQLALERKEQIEKAQQALLEWRNRHDIWDLERVNETQALRVQSLESEKTALLTKASEFEVQIDTLRSRQAATSGHIEPTEEMRNLAAKKSELESEIRELRQVYNDGSDVLALKLEEYSTVSRSYDREIQSHYNLEVSGLVKQRDEILRKVASLEAELKKTKHDKGLAQSQVELQRLEYELTVAKTNYQDALRRIDETKVKEQAKRNEAQFTLVERPSLGQAVGGSQPGYWKKDKILAGLVLSLLASVLLTLSLEHLKQSTSHRSQVESLGLTVLGVLPHTDAGHLGAYEDPRSILAEQIRRLVVGIKRKDGKVKSILVTSCWPSEGKSFVSCNLAASLTKFGLDVTLVDADLRKPFLSTFFHRESEPGLRQVLSGTSRLQSLAKSTEVPKLTFLPAGSSDSESPTELFSKAPGLFDDFCDSEDKFLIIDSAPISVCSDSIQLSDEVDAVILVVSSKKWTGRAEAEYVADLEEQGVEVFGLVLNEAEESELTHAYGYGYGRVYNLYYGKEAS